MKMNVSTQTLLSEEVIELLLKNYIITNGQNQLKDALIEYSSSSALVNNNTNDIDKGIQTATQTFDEIDCIDSDKECNYFIFIKLCKIKYIYKYT